MWYTIVQCFSAADGARWKAYLAWRGLDFERFDSLDGLMRPSLFVEPEPEDWAHIVNENFMLHYFTDLDHALRKWRQIGRGELLGVRFSEHLENAPGFLGFDLLDGYCDVSLLTNWGNDIASINEALGPNALIQERRSVEAIRRELLMHCADDAHVRGCRIVSVYRMGASVA